MVRHMQLPRKTLDQGPAYLTLLHRLIHYTPQATIVRLLTINAVNAYLTMTVLSFAGGFEDPRLMLPGWIGIATVRLPQSSHVYTWLY